MTDSAREEDRDRMDHISKALEKAAEERKSVRSWVRPDTQAKRTVVTERPTGSEVELDPQILQANRIIYDSKLDPRTTDVYRLLRTRVLQIMRANGWTKLGVTSAGPKSGKTLNAINLSFAIARDGAYDVMLVDADLRRPAIGKTLGIDAEQGINEYLTGSASLDDVMLTPTLVDRLTIVPGAGSPPDDANPELIGSERMRDLLNSPGRSKSDKDSVVVVDLPPVLVGDDVIALTPNLDCVLLVVCEGITNVDELKQTADLLAGTSTTVIGTILNNSGERQDNFDGYYGTGY